MLSANETGEEQLPYITLYDSAILSLFEEFMQKAETTNKVTQLFRDCFASQICGCYRKLSLGNPSFNPTGLTSKEVAYVRS